MMLIFRNIYGMYSMVFLFKQLPHFFVLLCASGFKVSPWDKREEANKKKLAFAVASSDHLALLQAYKVLTPFTESTTVM